MWLILFIVAGILFWYMFTQFETLRDTVDRLTMRVKDLESRGAAELAPIKEIPKAKPFKPTSPTALPTPPSVKKESIPPARPKADAPEPRAPVLASRTQIDWERFMGVQLFAWIGGFAFFLAAAFFVKYSIDHALISPLMRVSLGGLSGIGLIGGGLYLRRHGYATTVQALCAAGVSILYADIFACRSVYGFISPEVAFLLMALTTTASCILAIRLDSRYVGILGLIGGFLTPVLLST